MKKLLLSALALATLTFTSCDDDKEIVTDGGILAGGPFSFVVGDGKADNVSGITITGVQGTTTTYVITDADGKILGLPKDMTALKAEDFDKAPAGKCLIWHLAYDGAITGAEVGKKASEIKGNFDLSNSITVNRIPASRELKVDITGLQNLGADYVYEGWLIVDNKPVTTGTFKVDDKGKLSKSKFIVDTKKLAKATKFVLSIEPANDTDPAPAATKLLAGDFSGSSASVSSKNMLGDLSTAKGKYILATPTNGMNNNEFSGVWFLDNSGASSVAGLNLPTLPAGWRYEGWVVINGTPVSTGTFTDVSKADDNATISSYKGTLGNGPGYPGEDFVTGSAAGVTFPTDLKGATLVISVEPSPDNSAKPFVLKPLAHKVPADAKDHVAITMGAGPVSVITGTVSR